MAWQRLFHSLAVGVRPEFVIVPGSARRDLLPRLRSLFETEWGSIDPFTGVHPGVAVPEPLLALGSEGSLLAGLAFTTYESGIDDAVDVWVNTLLVVPEFRGLGIASRLVCAAQRTARSQGLARLLVRSAVPVLYQRQGWSALSSDAAETVLQAP